MNLIYNEHLQQYIELSPNREAHIAERHPELLPEHRNLLITTIETPEQIRISARFGNARLFSKWYSDLLGGKFIVVVVEVIIQ